MNTTKITIFTLFSREFDALCNKKLSRRSPPGGVPKLKQHVPAPEWLVDRGGVFYPHSVKPGKRQNRPHKAQTAV